jgi:dsDNA-binding SOS-regulon protein
MLEQDFLTVPGQVYALISIVGPDQPQKNDKLGMKIRGCFATKDEAAAHAKRLQKEDNLVDIYVVDMYKWLLIPPDRDQIDDVHYQNEKLEEIMSKYRQNQREAASHFEKRKRDMMATAIEGSATPFIEAGDENSKFYSKPDVPPIPHTAELIEDLKKEFPEADMQELVAKADVRIAAEIIKRREQLEKDRAAAAEAPPTIDAGPASEPIGAGAMASGLL